MRTTGLVHDVVQQHYLNDDDGAFNDYGDEWDLQVEALLDSESDIEENEV